MRMTAIPPRPGGVDSAYIVFRCASERVSPLAGEVRLGRLVESARVSLGIERFLQVLLHFRKVEDVTPREKCLSLSKRHMCEPKFEILE